MKNRWLAIIIARGGSVVLDFRLWKFRQFRRECGFSGQRSAASEPEESAGQPETTEPDLENSEASEASVAARAPGS